MAWRVVVSGFEPFGSFESNPTREGVRALREEARLGDRVAWLVLPVTYDGAPPVLLERVRRDGAVACVMFGLAKEARTLRLEASAYNSMATSAPDNAGVLREGVEIVPGGPAKRDAQGWFFDRVKKALAAAGVRAEVSEDPGRFVCNATYYRMLNARPMLPSLFVHVPPTVALGGTHTQDEITASMRSVVVAALAAIDEAGPVDLNGC